MGVPHPTEGGVEATGSGWAAVHRPRLHPLDRMEYTEWMEQDPPRGVRVHPHSGHPVGRPRVHPSIAMDAIAMDGRKAGPPSLPRSAPRDSGARPGGSPVRPVLPIRWLAGLGYRRRCSAPASSAPGGGAAAGFPLDPGRGQGETAGAQARGQGVEARPVKGGAARAVNPVKGVERRAGRRRKVSAGGHPGVGDTLRASPVPSVLRAAAVSRLVPPHLSSVGATGVLGLGHRVESTAWMGHRRSIGCCPSRGVSRWTPLETGPDSTPLSGFH